jgi:predicted esterase
MSCPHKLGGIIALSTWLALADKLPKLLNQANAATPIFQAHGEIDAIVRHSWAVKSRDILRSKYGREIEWHSYPNLEHSADPQEIDAMQKWMEQRIPPLGDFFNPRELGWVRD